MNFFEILRNDHHTLRLDLENLIEATTPSLDAPAKSPKAGKCLNRLKVRLNAHSRAEEAVLYERLRLIPHRDEMADDQIEEHHQIEEHLEALEKMGPEDSAWEETLSLLKNELESHLANEETTLFPILELALENEELNRLAVAFESSRDLTLESLGIAPQKKTSTAAAATRRP